MSVPAQSEAAAALETAGGKGDFSFHLRPAAGAGHGAGGESCSL